MDALTALRQSMRTGTPADTPQVPPRNIPDFAHAVSRFLGAWRAQQKGGENGFGRDTAVLLRQVARWFPGRLSLPQIPVEFLPWTEDSGLVQTADGIVLARPYRPAWLRPNDVPQQGIDEPPRMVRPIESVPAESYLRNLGVNSGRAEPRFPGWQSEAQKEAAWRVLNASPGSTALVVLPTGTGKSLIFQLLADLSRGLTVVIVPTIALAIDQWQIASEVLPELNPLYYAAEDRSDMVLAALDQLKTRLLFTSPEACVSGRLRGVLNREAIAGRLDNLVVDEVHIVESWGAFFRVDFQMLAGVRRSWMEGPGSRLRTLLLTATLTEPGRADLRRLFPPAGTAPWIELVGQRLRPEMVYYDRRFEAENERAAAILEALRYLPRPAILYVTEVDEAKEWYRMLSEEHGYRRLGCFHGETRTRERRRLLDAWRSDEIDLMIATSAFGLGVDKRDVRTVLHACFPEDMNRYYQEVGRGGRDGWSSVCLLLPTVRDSEVAQGLGPRYMTSELLQLRWSAMWQREFARPTSTAENVWELNPAAVRDGMLGKRTGNENIRWNKRLILQLHRAGLLRLRDVRYEYPEDEDQERQEWIEVELRFNPDSPHVGDMVEKPRLEEVAEARRGLEMVDHYLSGGECISRVLRRLYGPGTQRVCGGCRACRRAENEPLDCPPLHWERSQGTPAQPRHILVGSCPQHWRDGDTAFLAFIRGCMEHKGIRRFVAAPDRLERLMPLLDRLYGSLPAYLRVPYRIDPPPVQPLLGESVILLHFDRLIDEALVIRSGREAIHCISPPLTAQELRYAVLPHGVSDLGYFNRPEEWWKH